MGRNANPGLLLRLPLKTRRLLIAGEQHTSLTAIHAGGILVRRVPTPPIRMFRVAPEPWPG